MKFLASVTIIFVIITINTVIAAPAPDGNEEHTHEEQGGVSLIAAVPDIPKKLTSLIPKPLQGATSVLSGLTGGLLGK